MFNPKKMLIIQTTILMSFRNSTKEQMMLRKRKTKSKFISSHFILLLICYLGMLFLHKNARNICVAICFGFCKIIVILTGLRLAYCKLQQKIVRIKTYNVNKISENSKFIISSMLSVHKDIINTAYM